MNFLKCLQKKVSSKNHKAITEKNNAAMFKKFAAMPFSRRIVFAPHCLRSVSGCRAIDHTAYYVCVECKKCKIDNISNLARTLGYKAVYIAKGGSAIAGIVKRDNPAAVLGIACYYEGAQAAELVNNSNIAVLFCPLTKDGCSATDVDITEVEKIMNTLKETT
ncbi:MAG: DUF116 domain-containing protein [Elusimicrobia bacterium]|nr:DUF116 domain-containing protein [Elusimicrobiota bacterium]